MKKIIVSFAVLVVAIIAIFYIQEKYIYTPLSFEKDNVTYMSWYNYSKPLYTNYKNLEKGETLRLKTEKSIDILNHLKQAQEANPLTLDNVDKSIPTITLEIRNKNQVLLFVKVYEKNILKIEGRDQYLRGSHDFWKYIHEL